MSKHLQISKAEACKCLNSAIERGQIVVCQPSEDMEPRSQEKRKELVPPFYISRDSNLLSNELVEFADSKTLRSRQGLVLDSPFVKFNSRNVKKSNLQLTTSVDSPSKSFKTEELPQERLPQVKMRRERLVRSARLPTPSHHTLANNTGSLYMEKELAFLSALSRKPLPYMDLQSLFDVSKQTIKTLARNGIIEEIWGPKDIGVKFRLTEKGGKHLRRLKSAAKLKKNPISRTDIRLKHRIH